MRALMMSVLLLLGAPVVPGAEPILSAAQQEGRALAADLRQQRPAQSMTNSGILRLRDARGHRRDLPVLVTTLTGDEGWRIIYQIRDGTNGVLETFVVRLTGTNGPEYEVAERGTGASGTDPLKAVAAGASAVPVAGSDFWRCDLGLEFLHWPEQKVAKQEMSNGRLCWALDSFNPGTNGYASVRSWIDAEFHALLRAEAYDTQRRKVKEFSTGNFKQITAKDGREMWFLKDIHIRDEFKNTRTDLIYDLPGD